MSAEERTGWRDEALSRRHRLWGYDCPATDLDLPFLEYNHGEPVAIVEYKANGKVPDMTTPTMKAMARLADNSAIPFIVAVYTREPWTFCVYRGNEYAEKFYAKEGRVLTEREFVESLYYMRKQSLSANDQEVLAALDGQALVLA